MSGTQATPVRVRTIDHVTVIVKDLEASRKFYVDALGMDEVPRPDFSFAGSWFQAGNTQIHLILEHPESSAAGMSVAADKMASTRTHHFAFEVENAHLAAERMHELGVPVVAGPKSRPDGAVQVFVTDPDGHVIELCSVGSA